MTVSRDAGHPLTVRALPVPADGLLFQAAAVVLLGDPDQSVAPDEAFLAAFGLAVAERRLVAALVEGHSLEGYAEQVRLSVHTVRSVLRTVFGKTATNRQSEFILLALKGIP